MEGKYLVLVLCILGYVGAVLAGIWQLVPSDVANSGRDAMLTIIAIILAAIAKRQGEEIHELKVRLGLEREVRPRA
jgi:hypothetical protein